MQKRADVSFLKQYRDMATSDASASALRVPIAVSARHAHLSKDTIDRLFGHDYSLNVRTLLSQPGQFAAQETISLIGPAGRIDNVRLMGPPRARDQIEISRSDERTSRMVKRPKAMPCVNACKTS